MHVQIQDTMSLKYNIAMEEYLYILLKLPMAHDICDYFISSTISTSTIIGGNYPRRMQGHGKY